MKHATKLAFTILLLFLPCFVFAQEFLPSYRGQINDYAQVLSTEYEAKIRALIDEIELKTSAEIVVAAISSIAPYTESQYAQMLFDEWKIGKKGKDNGVLVLLAVKERRWRIHTGYGLEAILTDALCSEIGRNRMAPYFKSGDYAQGLFYGTASLAGVIAKDAGISLNGLKGVHFKSRGGKKAPLILYFIMPAFFAVWNIPWPIFIGLPFTALFAVVMFGMSPLLGFLIIVGYVTAMLIRVKIWSKIPATQRRSLFYILLMGFIWHKKGKGKNAGRWVSGMGGSGGSSGSSGGGGGSSGGGGAGGGF